MSRRIGAVEQGRYVAGASSQPTCLTTRELRMRMKYARKPSFFVVAVIYATTEGTEQIRACVMINPSEVPIDDEARMMLMLQTQVCDCISADPGLPHQKKETGK